MKYKIYLLDKLKPGLSPHPTSLSSRSMMAVDLKQSQMNRGTPSSGGEDLVVLPPASPQSDEKLLQSQSFPQSHERCRCWRAGTCGRDIFISPSFPSLPIQNKLELVGKMVHDEKRIPWLALPVTTGYMDPCHCSGTAAPALASQLSATFPDKTSKPTAAFPAAEKQH